MLLLINYYCILYIELSILYFRKIVILIDLKFNTDQINFKRCLFHFIHAASLGIPPHILLPHPPPSK